MQTEEKPIEPSRPAGDADSAWPVWKRRIVFGALILMCVSFAAPAMGTCEGALSGGGPTIGTLETKSGMRRIRESEFADVSSSLRGAAIVQRQGERARLSVEDIWSHIMADQIARDAGIHVPDEQIRNFLVRGGFVRDEAFDRALFNRVLKEAGVTDSAAVLERIREQIRIDAFRSAEFTGFGTGSSSEIYDEWKKSHVKVDVDFVASPYARHTAKAESDPITDAELQQVANFPEVLTTRTVAARRGLEVAVLKVAEVTPETRAAMEKLLLDAFVFDSPQRITGDAWSLFSRNRKASDPFSRENWIRLRKPAFEAAKAAYDVAKAAWDAAPEPKPGVAPVAPSDPAAAEWPKESRDEFTTHWREIVEREVLTRATMQRFLERAERESKSFQSLAPEFAACGIRIVVNPAPLADSELTEMFPEGLAKETELANVVRTGFPHPAADKAFVPKVHPETISATRMNDRVADRGALGVRWASVEPATLRDVTDPIVRSLAEGFVRTRRATEAARDELAAVRKDAEAAGTGLEARRAALRSAAQARGFEVVTIRSLNQDSWRPTPPSAAADAAAEDPAIRAKRARVLERLSVHDEVRQLQTLEPGAFRDPIRLDDASGAAILTLVVAKNEPGPVELTGDQLDFERRMRLSRVYQQLLASTSFDGLKPIVKLSFAPEYEKRFEESRAAHKKELERLASRAPSR